MNAMNKAVLAVTAIIIVAADAHAGRWLARDPIQEGAGFVQRDPMHNEPNLYAFIANNPVGNVDFLGLWKIKREGSKNWALAESEGPQDTKESLAKLIRLDYAEFSKWAKPAGKCNFLVPNTVVVYTSKKSGLDYMITPIVNTLRSMAVKGGKNYEAKGYKVLYNLDKSSEELFISLWTTDGIFAYAFGGHGAEDQLGFVAAPGSGSAVGPKEVFPPYHLQAIGAYSCSSALDIIHVTPIGPNETGKWRDLISGQGTFVGYTADVWWGNVWWNEESVNPGVIPP